LSEDGEIEFGDVGPDVWIGAGTNMGMDPDDFQLVFCGDFADFVGFFVPDSEARSGAADVGAVAVPRAESGIETNADRGAGKSGSKPFELVEGAGVDRDSGADEVGEVFWSFL